MLGENEGERRESKQFWLAASSSRISLTIMVLCNPQLEDARRGVVLSDEENEDSPAGPKNNKKKKGKAVASAPLLGDDKHFLGREIATFRKDGEEVWCA